MEISSRSILNISEFTRTEDKTSGVTRGFIATKGGEKYLIKEFKNGKLTDAEKQERLTEFRKSFIAASRISLKKKLPRLTDNKIEKTIEEHYEKMKDNILSDDLNIGDCIREYISAPIYRKLLDDRAPEVFLVKDDKEKGKIYLASKFLENFTTVSDHITHKTEDQYQQAEGYERILAAQILVGEADIVQTGNFGTIASDSNTQHFAKIDHGKSLYTESNNPLILAQVSLFDVRQTGIKINSSTLKSELKRQTKILTKKSKEIETEIRGRIHDLEEHLDHNMTFTLRTIDQINILAPLTCTEFHYDTDKKHFISQTGKTLEDYFVSEFRRYKSRANLFDQYINKAIKGGAVVIVSSGGVFVAAFFKSTLIEKMGEKSQKAILGLSITVLCLSAIYVLFQALANNGLQRILEGEIDAQILEAAYKAHGADTTLSSTSAENVVDTDTKRATA